MYLTCRLQPRGGALFLCETFHWHWAEAKKLYFSPRRSRVGSDGRNSDGKWAEFNFPFWNVCQDIAILQQEDMPFSVLNTVKTNILPQGQGWSGSEFSIRMLRRLSQVLGMGRDFEPVLMGTERPSAFLRGGKERGGQTLHPSCLSPASRSPSVILRGECNAVFCISCFAALFLTSALVFRWH